MNIKYDEDRRKFSSRGNDRAEQRGWDRSYYRYPYRQRERTMERQWEDQGYHNYRYDRQPTGNYHNESTERNYGDNYRPREDNRGKEDHRQKIDNRMIETRFNEPRMQRNNQFGTEKIVGNKPQNILVRELWLGGIPYNFDKMHMHHIMSHFGMVEYIYIFPKFAFVKFKMVKYATLAFERADQICSMLGNPQGFRIFFSDPSRRKHIVSNHYYFERQGVSVPILFLGFHPITSANIDLEHLKSICEKFGPIVGEYMRSNTNTQNRSYFMFTYDNLKTAQRAKMYLSKRRDLLGDKRAYVTLLLDEQDVLKGRDLSHTLRNYQGEIIEKTRYSTRPPNQPKSQPLYYDPMSLKHLYPPQLYPNNIYGYMPQFYPPHMQQPGYYYPNSMLYNQDKYQYSHGYIHYLLQTVCADNQPPEGEQKPVRTGDDYADIIHKLLGYDSHKEYRYPSWSGFILWRGLKRIGIDGYSQNIELEDSAINIMSVIDPKDIILEKKEVMVLCPSSKMFLPAFQEYTKNLKGKIGVFVNSQYLIYVMAKCPESDEIQTITYKELLAVLERHTLFAQIKDKCIKLEYTQS